MQCAQGLEAGEKEAQWVMESRLSAVAVHTSEGHPPHLVGTHTCVDEMLEHQAYISNSLRGISNST